MKSAAELSRLQNLLLDACAARLAQSSRQREAFAAEQRVLLEAMDREPAGGGRLVHALAMALRRVDGLAARGQSAHAALLARAVEQSARARAFDRLKNDVSAKARAHEEQKQLADLIDQALSGDSQAPCKVPGER